MKLSLIFLLATLCFTSLANDKEAYILTEIDSKGSYHLCEPHDELIDVITGISYSAIFYGLQIAIELEEPQEEQSCATLTKLE